MLNQKMKQKLAELRETLYQQMLEMLSNTNTAHLSCVTGFGKTVMFRRYIKEFSKQSILYVTDRADACAIMRDYMKKHNEKNDTITYMALALKKTLKSRLEFIKGFDTLIFDESHLMGAHNCDKVVQLAQQEGMTLIGGSASPLRADGNNIAYTIFKGNEIKYGMRQAITDGFLKEPFVITTIYLGFKFKEVLAKVKLKRGNDWALSKLNGMERAIAERNTIKSSIAKAVEVSGRGIWIVFHPNIKALKYMREEIDNAFFALYGDVQTFAVTSDKEHLNVRQFKEQHNGFSVVHAVDMMTTGWHFEDISGLVFNSMTGSPVREIQQLGRAVELGSDRVTSIVDLVGRFTARKNKFIIDTDNMGSKGSNAPRQELEQFDIDTLEFTMQFEKILDAIEFWATHEARISPEVAVHTVRKFGHLLGHAARACGLTEELLSEMVAASQMVSDASAG